MKSSSRILGLGLLFIVSLSAKELPIGSPIPLGDVKMRDVSGSEVSLNKIKGPNGLLVIFSCNTCPWVKAWEDRYVTIAESYKPKGLGIVAVNPNEAYREKGDSFEDMQVYAKEKGYNFYYTLDKGSRLAKVFGATRTPHIFLFNKEGILVYRGAIDDNARHAQEVKRHYLLEALDQMLAGKPISLPSTKALGCSIKFAEGSR